MVDFNVANFITIGLIVLAFIFALRYAFKMAGKSAPI